MSANNPAGGQPGSCQLYLTISAHPGDATRARLQAALGAGPVASVLLTSPVADAGSEDGTVQGLIGIIQENGAAALIADNSTLARQASADGVHLWSAAEDDEAALAALQTARETLLQDFIIGASAGQSRDLAMRLGERGADYVAFSQPPHSDDQAAALDEQLKLITWWSDIFEIPCVAFDVSSPNEAAALAAAGADFIAINLAEDQTPGDVAASVKSIAEAVLEVTLAGRGTRPE